MMTAQDFENWLDHMGLKGAGAARALGLAPNSVVKYRREGAPLTVALACAALAFGLPPWSRPAGTGDES